MAGIFSQISNDITYPLIGAGVGFVTLTLVMGKSKQSMVGGIIGALAGGALGYALAQKGPSTGTGTLSVANTNITIGSGLLGTTYTPSSTNVSGSGFSAGTTVYIQDENGNTVGSAYTGPLGNFNNLGTAGTGGPISFGSYSPIAGTGYLVVLDPNTGLYSNKVTMTYTNSVLPNASITVTPMSVGPTSWAVSVSGSGFGSFADNLSVYFSPPLEAIQITQGATATGDIGPWSITLPTTQTITQYQLYVKDMTSGQISNTVNISVTPNIINQTPNISISPNSINYLTYSGTIIVGVAGFAPGSTINFSVGPLLILPVSLTLPAGQTYGTIGFSYPGGGTFDTYIHNFGAAGQTSITLTATDESNNSASAVLAIT